MSENDRMERARRIRRMREGQRDGEEADSDADETDMAEEPAADGEASAGDGGGSPREGPDEPAETPDEQAAASETPGEPTTASSTEATASTDGGASARVQQETDSEASEADADAATPEPEVEDAVGNVGGTTAELPSTEQMEAAMEQTMEQVEDDTDAESEAEAEAEEEPASPATGIAGESDVEQTQEADTRVLEFTLDDEQYCLDIQYIEEIVKHTAITRVPNTPDFVEGVVDLRGQITTILNPKVTIDKDDKSAGDLIVVFDGEAFEDQGHIGWVVDDVRQVSPVSEDEVNDPPMEEDYINGVIDREDEEFVIWTTPDLALEEAE